VVEFEKGDLILEIDGTRIDYVWEKTVENLVVVEDGNSYDFTVKKTSGEVVHYNVVVQTAQQQDYNAESNTYVDAFDEETGDPVMFTGLGINMALTSVPVSFLDALWQCFTLAFGFSCMVLKTFWLLITFQLPISQLGGTLTVISTVASSLDASLGVVLVYLPLIAVNLAVFNLLPLPALDGGHVVFTGIEAARGKPINRNVESTIHFVGLIVLFAFIIFLDLYHFLG
ncbi:MAG: site-2 protease family protein, partial [Clostridia bacterium]|nr:site-2 protease family protein [Clostridia bacterium]